MTWRITPFLHGTPGRRFQALHRVRRGRHRLVKLATMSAGALIMMSGVLLLFTPGPGALALLFGAGLIASESLAFARALDRVELRLRSLFD